jgi:multiple sugar transport system substrate-binding protein
MTDERERREFNAGLSAEVDAWLRGDTSRRELLTRFMLLGGAAMLPGLGYTASGSKAWAAMADVSKVELADKSTPLGQAQAAAVKASSEGPTDGSAYRAVQAAQQYKDKGITLNLTYEAGLQALEPKNFSGPLWQALTGINFDVVELPQADRRTHRGLRRLRRSRHRAGLDPGARERRRHSADRRLCRQVHEQV